MCYFGQHHFRLGFLLVQAAIVIGSAVNISSQYGGCINRYSWRSILDDGYFRLKEEYPHAKLWKILSWAYRLPNELSLLSVSNPQDTKALVLYFWDLNHGGLRLDALILADGQAPIWVFPIQHDLQGQTWAPWREVDYPLEMDIFQAGLISKDQGKNRDYVFVAYRKIDYLRNHEPVEAYSFYGYAGPHSPLLERWAVRIDTHTVIEPRPYLSNVAGPNITGAGSNNWESRFGWYNGNDTVDIERDTEK